MTIKHIVIGSGGLALLIQQGIIGELLKLDIINLSNIKSIYTCSCGSIIGTILSLGHDPDLIYDYIIKRPWGEHLPQINPFSLFDVDPPKGLYDRTIFTTLFEPLLDVKGISIDVTLKELYDITGIKIVYMTTNLNDAILREYELSYITHPDWKVIDAIHASCGIIPIISPFELEGDCYIDGGTLCYFPYNNCIECEKCDESEIFGICTKFKHTTVLPGNNIMDLIGTLICKSWVTLNRNVIKEYNHHNIIHITVGERAELHKIQYVLDNMEERESIYKSGVEYADIFIASHQPTIQ